MNLDELRMQINKLDEDMKRSFLERMKIAKAVAEYKLKNGLPILDEERENAMIEKNSAQIDDEMLRKYYIEFLKNNIAISKQYQAQIFEENND